jgi:hypothetical protein
VVRGHAAFAFFATEFRSAIRNARALPPDERTRLKVVLDRGSRIIRFLFLVDGEAERAQSRCVAWLNLRLNRLLAAEPPLHAPETGPSGKLKRYLLPTDMRDASPFALHCRSKLWTAATTLYFLTSFSLYPSFWQEGKGVAAIVCSFFDMRAADANAIIGCIKGGRHLTLHGDESLMPTSAWNSRRAWMERHDPAVRRIVVERAVNGIISRADEDGSDGRRRRVHRR